MPGYSSVPVIADAYLKGFTGFDAEEALQAMKATATYEKQKGVPYVIEKGYIPADKIHEATSIAMEYAVDDWGIAAMARKMGKTGDAATYAKRAHYYKTTSTLPSTSFVRSWKTVPGVLLMTRHVPSIPSEIFAKVTAGNIHFRSARPVWTNRAVRR